MCCVEWAVSADKITICLQYVHRDNGSNDLSPQVPLLLFFPVFCLSSRWNYYFREENSQTSDTVIKCTCVEEIFPTSLSHRPSPRSRICCAVATIISNNERINQNRLITENSHKLLPRAHNVVRNVRILQYSDTLYIFFIRKKF